MMKNCSVKLLAALVAVMMLVSMMPAALAASSTTVVPYTEPATVQYSADGKTIDVYFGEVVVTKKEAGPAGGNAEAWWLGVNVIAPDNFNNPMYHLASARKNPADPFPVWNTDFNDWQPDEPNSMQLWVNIGNTEDFVKQFLADYRAAGKNIVYRYEFKWNSASDEVQTINLIIQPEKVTAMDDTGVNVLVPPAPTVPAAPADPAAGGSHSHPKTGDSTPIALLGVLLVVSVLGMTIMRRKAYR